MEPAAGLGIAVALIVIGFVIFALIFRLIWNWTVPAVFGLRAITFWQAVGILILSSILFGGHRVVSTDLSNLPKRVESPKSWI
jgi:hypothetical protein